MVLVHLIFNYVQHLFCGQTALSIKSLNFQAKKFHYPIKISSSFDVQTIKLIADECESCSSPDMRKLFKYPSPNSLVKFIALLDSYFPLYQVVHLPFEISQRDMKECNKYFNRNLYGWELNVTRSNRLWNYLQFSP